MHRIGAQSAEALWKSGTQTSFWNNITTFLMEHAIQKDDFATKIGDNVTTIQRIENQIDRGNYEIKESERHEVWSVFVNFLCSFEQPTVPKDLAKILKNAGILLS